MIGWAAGGLVLAVWLYLALARGGFWRTSVRLPRPATDPAPWPSVVAVVPARDEAALLPATLPTLLGQDYPGEFRVLVVDDASSDGTGDLAARLGADVVRSAGPPPGWTGKVAALAAGVAAAGEPDWLLFTDADIRYAPGTLRGLVAAAGGRVLVSQMALLRTWTGWERLVVPAFVYFFAQLYPFTWVNRPGHTAAAAGGCVLLRRAALADAGGLAAVSAAVIDDVAIARLLRPHGRIWLGLSRQVVSVRPYPGLADLWQMVARSAYTQLRYSPLFLLGTVLGLLVTYALPPALLVAGLLLAAPGPAALAGLAWATMTLTYVPMLRFYRLSPARALLLPVTAVLYLAMTVDSARRHRSGRGARWKGRTAAA